EHLVVAAEVEGNRAREEARAQVQEDREHRIRRLDAACEDKGEREDHRKVQDVELVVKTVRTRPQNHDGRDQNEVDNARDDDDHTVQGTSHDVAAVEEEV